MQKWEYRTFLMDPGARQMVPNQPTPGTEKAGAPGDLPSVLNQLGEDGWELCGVVGQGERGSLMIFKRPMSQAFHGSS